VIAEIRQFAAAESLIKKPKTAIDYNEI